MMVAAGLDVSATWGDVLRTVEGRASACLVVGPSSFGTCASIARGFRQLGWQTEAAIYDLGQHGAKYRLRRLARHAGVLSWYERTVFNRLVTSRVMPVLRSAQPDLVVFVKPYELATASAKALATCSAKIVTWATDSLSRLPGQRSLWQTAAANYVMDGGDVEPGASSWLPLGYDEELFHPSDEEPQWDVLFVGNIFPRGYERRAEFFEALRTSSIADRYKVGFVGSLPNRGANRSRQLRGSMHWLSTGLGMRRLGAAISRSKICVNIHQDEGQQPVNPLLFAIPGCRSCLVTDHRQHIGRWLVPGSEMVATSLLSFGADLERLLEWPEERRRVAERGLEAARRHTYTRHVERIIGDVVGPRPAAAEAEEFL